MTDVGELAVLIDDKNRIIGYRDKIEAHRWPTPLHRAISVVLFDKDKVLLQKRSANKPIWPLYWSNTVCANVTKAETYEECAKRRLQEEMGIKTNIKEVFKFKYRRRYNKIYGEHELDTVFIGEYSGSVIPDPDEAADYKWMGKRDLVRDIRKNPQKYTPWFKIILKKLEIL